MGTGSSGIGGGSKKGSASSQPKKASTPSGISYDQFMKMSDTQKYSTMHDIINNPNIVVPSYLDKSITSKVMYGLGMTSKPTVVSDDQLDKMPGAEAYRTVYDTNWPPPYAQDILDQIRTGDYTQLSGSGGSAHSRALYFSSSFRGSVSYGNGRTNSTVMRVKINPTAKLADEATLSAKMRADANFSISSYSSNADRLSLYAIVNGYDGWTANVGWRSNETYTMIVNRGCLTASSQNKGIAKRSKMAKRATASSWKDAVNK